MVEYILDVIKANAGEIISITATITNDEEIPDLETSSFVLLDDENNEIYIAEGNSLGENRWFYEIPSQVTSSRTGKYWYYILGDGKSLCFKNPIYLC